jgi:hypothetical protein
MLTKALVAAWNSRIGIAISLAISWGAAVSALAAGAENAKKPDSDFRQHRWGDTEAAVLRNETAKLVANEEDRYVVSLVDTDFSLRYAYVGGRLIGAAYTYDAPSLVRSAGEENAPLAVALEVSASESVCDRVLKVLTEKYGRASEARRSSISVNPAPESFDAWQAGEQLVAAPNGEKFGEGFEFVWRTTRTRIYLSLSRVSMVPGMFPPRSACAVTYTASDAVQSAMRRESDAVAKDAL